jgi:predicted DNA-binding protein (MmcQ/YjbR family)
MAIISIEVISKPPSVAIQRCGRTYHHSFLSEKQSPCPFRVNGRDVIVICWALEPIAKSEGFAIGQKAAMTTRKAILAYIKSQYGIEPDYPWRRNPNYAILRHKTSRKWLAAIIDISKGKLGLKGDNVVDVLNLKCDPLLIGPLQKEAGIFPAYHMNKEHWISVLLESPIPKEKVFGLIDLSYDLTK